MSPEPVTARIAIGHVDVCRTSVPWVCSTPFGSAVDPEVCTMMARSAGETSVLDGGQHVERNAGGGLVVDVARPAPVPVASEHDGAQVWRRRHRELSGALAGQLRQGRFETVGDVDVQHLAGSDEQRDVGEPQHLGDLSRLVHRAHRNGQRADAGRREPPDDPLDAVGEEQSDAGALADPVAKQPARDVRRALLRLADRSAGRSA